MKRLVWLVMGAGLVAFGCGDDGGGDDMPPNPGFVNPVAPTEAFSEINGVWESQGAADWSCLNTPNDDTATSVEVTLTGTIEDFQTGNAVPAATVEMFDNVDTENPFVTTTSDEDGLYSLVIPAGHTRVGFKLTAEGQEITLLLNQIYEPDQAAQSESPGSVSELTANALPAFIGVTRTPELGVLAGAIRDCNDNEVANAIATISSVSGSPEHLEGAQSYYFSAGSTSLPVRLSQQDDTNSDGLFMIIEAPPGATAFLQLWGYPTQADLDADNLTLLAEIPSPILQDVIVTFSIEPLRSN